ncbi:MAG: TonB-dependent receptor [Prolixibacteraceae bacterium]
MKKIPDDLSSWPREKIKIILLKMKLLSLIMFVGTMAFSANSYSQKTKIDLQFDNSTLIEILGSIEKKSEFIFVYNANVINSDLKKSISVKGETIDKILDLLFQDEDVSFRVDDRQVFLYKSEEMNNPVLMKETVKGDQQLKKVISGIVKDVQGLSLPGVSVVVKGTTTGTVTDMDGKFQLIVPTDAQTLIFSFVGMKSQEIVIGNSKTINVALTEETVGIEEVVAVGYGSQKKVNLTGSITAIKTAELSDIPMPNISQTLMGRTPGLFIKNVNGQPGDATSMSLTVRGFGTPLIIIDGVPATMNEFQLLNSNEIEDFNVLKDASAAVYGARAGNGVILVTTKRGAISPTKVTFSSVLQMQHFLVIPKWVNSADYARMLNLALYNQGKPPVYTDEAIQKFADGSDPEHYPNTNWWDKAIRPLAPQAQQNISVQGGNEKVKYFVAGGYFYQEAMPRANETKDKRYNIRSNIDIKLTKKMNLNLDLSGMYDDYVGPIIEMERQSHVGLMTCMFRSVPFVPFQYPDPTKLPGGVQDPYHYSFSENYGYKKWNRFNADAKVGFSYDLPLGIKARANFHINKENFNNLEKDTKNPKYLYNYDTQIYTPDGFTVADQKIYKYTSNTNRIDQQYFLNWNKKFINHNVSAMVVYEVSKNNNDWFEASRTHYDMNIDYLFAGPNLDKTNNGSASLGGRKGIISRLNYDYKGKYLLELNSRYDASANFPPATRWGFFPSASLGWRISEEGFIKNNLPFVSNLKLRVSDGKLGDDNTGNFQYLSTYSISGSYIYDGASNIANNGIATNALPNDQITWMKMVTKNAGVDFSLWNNLLEGSFDYFYRLRTDILGSRIQSIPNVVGASLPQVNYAKSDNRGWEFSLNHSNKIGAVTYNLGGNISWNRAKTIFVDQAAFTNDEARRRGDKNNLWSDVFWGYMSDGLFQSRDEINKWADQDGKGNSSILPGDVKYIDYNGDGKITSDDNVIIGRGTMPQVMYGINMSLAWKGLDFSMLWQGAGRYDFNLLNAPDYTISFYASNTPMTYMLNGAYIPPNPWLPTNTSNVQSPLFRLDARSLPTYSSNSQYWLINGAYIRLKNIELGYTLPASFTGKWGIEKCKFFVSAYNLLTFSSVSFIDPEADTGNRLGDYYPPVGTYNIGFSLQF